MVAPAQTPGRQLFQDVRLPLKIIVSQRLYQLASFYIPFMAYPVQASSFDDVELILAVAEVVGERSLGEQQPKSTLSCSGGFR